MNLKTSKPPYLLGLLCLIPVLGGFAGIVLFILGLVRYKNKWMIMMGAMGIILSIASISYLFHFIKNNDLTKKGFAAISQIQLNTLVKDVEFYKLQYGHYPKNLTELSQEDPMSPINDPVRPFEKSNYYNYELVGEKYLLFSSGIDGVPNSSDDMVPEFRTGNNSKIGWIRNR